MPSFDRHRESLALEALSRLFLARDWETCDQIATAVALRRTGFPTEQLESWLIHDIQPIFGVNLSGFEVAPEQLGWLPDDVEQMVDEHRRLRSRPLSRLGWALLRLVPGRFPRLSAEVRRRWRGVADYLSQPTAIRSTPPAAALDSESTGTIESFPLSRTAYERLDFELARNRLPRLGQSAWNEQKAETFALHSLAQLFVRYRLSAWEQAVHAAVLRRTGYTTARLEGWLLRDIAPLFSGNQRPWCRAPTVLGWQRDDVRRRVDVLRARHRTAEDRICGCVRRAVNRLVWQALPRQARDNWATVRRLLEQPASELECDIASQLRREP